MAEIIFKILFFYFPLICIYLGFAFIAFWFIEAIANYIISLKHKK